MRRFENSSFVVLWILERFGKMEKWDKLWDIGIYFVDGKE
jgi:hypothetical protein